MATQYCSGCGADIAPQNVLYTATAQIVCAKCYAAADIIATDIRHAKRIRSLAIGSVLAGVGTMVAPLSGFAIVVIAFAISAVSSGIYAIIYMGRGNERFTKHLSAGDKALVWICSIGGIALGGSFALFWLLGIQLLVR